MKRKLKNTKKTLGAFLCVPLVFSCVPMAAISASAIGAENLKVAIDTGTQITLKDADTDGYYDIRTADELYAFAYAVNGGKTSINAELKADIVVNKGVMSSATDSTAVRAWIPVGSKDKQYNGIFSGDNHTVSGLYFNNWSASGAGLFGYLGSTANVKHVGVINSYFCGGYIGSIVGTNSGTITNCHSISNVIGNSYAGGIAGENTGTITNCHNTGNVSGIEYAGAVAGCNSGTITNSYNKGTVYADNYVGGISGIDNGKITNSYNTGYVSGIDYVGGIVGFGAGTITNSYNIGELSCVYDYIGGIAGCNVSGTIANCHNKGAVKGGDYVNVGGVVGSNNNIITNCYNTGDVTANYHAGGVCGNNEGTITNSYNKGAVKAGSAYVSGIAVYNYGTIQNCYNTGAGRNSVAIGVVSANYGKITNCYYLANSEKDAFDGTAFKTDAQFKSGEVAYLLQQGVTADGGEAPKIWGQKIGTDDSPVIGGDKIYTGYKDCHSISKSYANKELYAEVPNHSYQNGVCTICGNNASTLVSVIGDIAIALEKTEENIYTGVVELQAGTYNFNVEDRGTKLGMNYTYTDTATINYSAGYKAPSKLIANGGRYTFTYNASSKVLKIEYKNFNDIVELYGDIHVELVRTSKNSTVYTGSARIDAGSYKFKINDQGTKMGFGFVFNDVVYGVQYSEAYSSSTTFNATGGIYSVSYDTATNKLTFKHAPKGLGDVRVFGDIDLPLARQGNNVYSAATTLDVGSYQFRVDSLGTTVCNGYEFTNGMNGVEYKAEWKGATTLKVTSKQKFTFIFDADTNRIKVLGSPIDATKVLVAFEDSNLELRSSDGVNYAATIKLNAGTYVFRMDEFGVTMGYGGTYNDKINGITYDSKFSSATTFVATGGTYKFSYNVDTNRLRVVKVD
ncbi:MAG: GLUG motif-containing protein [Acutalibacteraceae bacterium]|nr:GLUG motif-containing protein [Acutalibacteraceae bacterium]